MEYIYIKQAIIIILLNKLMHAITIMRIAGLPYIDILREPGLMCVLADLVWVC